MRVDTKVYTEKELLRLWPETYSFSYYKLMVRITLGNIVIIIILTFTISLSRFLIANSNS
jgi:hypothetical protein